jgi:hypothetical protein
MVVNLVNAALVDLELPCFVVGAWDLARPELKSLICGSRVFVLEHSLARIRPMPVRLGWGWVDVPWLELTTVRTREIRIGIWSHAGSSREMWSEAKEVTVVITRVVSETLKGR